MGRVEIVTLRVSVRAKEGKGGGEKPFPPLLGRFQQGAFASKNICASKENAYTAGYVKQSREKMNTLHLMLEGMHFN